MTAARVVVVSDTHLSAAAPEAADNWAAVVDHLAGNPPDLVIHAGDVTLDGVVRPAELEFARELLDRLPAPWVAVPGNHDIGDNPGASTVERDVSEERLGRWIGAFGPDRWEAQVGGWAFVGINAQLFGSGLDAEAEQWEWLRDRLDHQRSGPVGLVCHKPLLAPAGELQSAPVYRFVPEPHRGRLLDEVGRVPVDVVVSGHVHQFRRLAGPFLHVWAPTTWAVLPESVQPTFGSKRCGLVELELRRGGSRAAGLVVPFGLGQYTIGTDFADPYDQ